MAKCEGRDEFRRTTGYRTLMQKSNKSYKGNNKTNDKKKERTYHGMAD